MNILVINAGSSSLKYQLIRMEDETILCKGVCERIGIDGKYSYKTAGGYAVEKDTELFTHKDAFDVILHEMVSGEGHVIDSVEEIAAVGDGLNDLELLEYAGIGAAMGNGVPELKQTADRVLPPVEEDGLAKFVQELLA